MPWLARVSASALYSGPAAVDRSQRFSTYSDPMPWLARVSALALYSGPAAVDRSERFSAHSDPMQARLSVLRKRRIPVHAWTG
ncbi:transporter, major facilitator family [Burkholderia pseudomallei]|nr:transporter, major facilitator family [Burkholderia pseudomallei]